MGEDVETADSGGTRWDAIVVGLTNHGSSGERVAPTC